MNRGEIYWYKLKDPDKNRPVVIITRQSALSYLNDVTIAPITSTIRSIPTEVVIDEKDGMKSLCAINLDHIQTISKTRLGPYITSLSRKRIKELNAALSFALEITL
jgi:mRNA interferase MazF